MYKTGVKIDVKMKPTDKILGRIFDDSAGRFLAETWGKIFEKYVPMDSGTLSQRYDTEPYKVIYNQKYSYYQWYGISKKGNPLNYNKEQHFLAQSHWEEAAERDKAGEVANALTAYIKRRG